ncbi:hypothetical protein OCS_00681 [Ophiocordyceps sinensis CO18]|uniref:Uncharacterized protein n=1 Tax=Ophiocordyceps sinensis (strain Co18 / CGMCC 3.14243) TaxID=911162 RepID=T5AMF7_OPHSC|nr:hypothetical protein OCS_00681 [Ophiocordyceps sinensis CO18]
MHFKILLSLAASVTALPALEVSHAQVVKLEAGAESEALYPVTWPNKRESEAGALYPVTWPNKRESEAGALYPVTWPNKRAEE